MRTTGYSVAKSKILFIRFSYLFGSVLTVLLKIRYLKLFYGIFVYYSLLKFRLNTIFCQFLKARVFFLCGFLHWPSWTVLVFKTNISPF